MVKPTPPTAPEAPLRSDPAFSAKAQAFLTWLSGGFYSYVGDAVDFVDERADEALAAATTFGFPSIAGKALNQTRVNAAGTALEFRTPAQVRGDIGAPALPISSAGAGQFGTMASGIGAAFSVPAGGTWAIGMTIVDSTGAIAGSQYFTGVVAGGTQIWPGVTGQRVIGFGWRIA
jgi:hypothetical protein